MHDGAHHKERRGGWQFSIVLLDYSPPLRVRARLQAGTLHAENVSLQGDFSHEFDGGEYNIGDNHCRDHGDNRNIEGCIGDIVEGGINAFGADTEPSN